MSRRSLIGRDVTWRIEYPSYGDSNFAHLQGSSFPLTRWRVPAAQRRLERRPWDDLLDRTWPVLPVDQQLAFSANAAAAALRLYVFTLGMFTCAWCGMEPDEMPAFHAPDGLPMPVTYAGDSNVLLPSGDVLVVDHILSRRNGGSNHPWNLQPLCATCNTRKVAWVDSVISNALFTMGAR